MQVISFGFKLTVNQFGYVRAKHNSSNHKSKSFHSSRQFAVFVWRGCGDNEVERAEKAETSRLEALAVGKACYALYSYSRLKEREPL